MATIDTRPQIVDISAYGGDTLNITVTAPEALTAGMAWSAQVRANRDLATAVDATFVITPPVAPDLVAHLMLKAEDCRRLIGTGAVKQRRMRDGSVRSVQTYTGVWDCEIHHPTDPDPVTTLVQGSLTLDMDVTRTAAP